MTDAGSSAPPDGKTITEHELEQCQRANQTGHQPVVFVHGLWPLPSSKEISNDDCQPPQY